MSNFFYYQVAGGEEKWSAVPSEHKHHIQTEMRPMFFTVLSVSKLVEDLPYEEKLKLTYEGPLYFDFDSEDEQLVIEKVQQFITKLEEMRVNLGMCRLYATGGRGYHIEVPWKIFIDKPPKTGIVNLAATYREIALDLCVDTLDLRVYSQGRGRMWRQTNVQRPNGRYKVPITLGEMKVMTPELCQSLTASPRQELPILPAEFCVPLSILYSKCSQKVEELAKRRSKIKPDPKAREKAYCDSVQWMMAGLGIKPGVGFQELSTQLAIAATSAGLTEADFISACSGLINDHQGDGSRYNSPGKREEELRRMWRYMEGNLCYEFSVGAIKSLLTHSAPDLDGITSTREEIKEVIDEAAKDLEEDGGETVDEYADVAKGVTLAKYGTYLDTEYGKKRICAISFTGTNILMSCETGQISAYTTNVMVNGRVQGKQTLELEAFAGLTSFTKLASRYGHAFQGNDVQVRSMMMRFVEQAKKRGNMQYICKREGVDLLHIESHANPELRIPFLLWADAEGVITEPRITATGQEMVYAGYPDVRGVFRSDLRDAPKLLPWLEELGNREALKDTIKNLITCQRPEMLGKIIGWYVACFYKQIFHKVYGKFPLLHVNGAAGAGKTENILSMSSFFYYMNETKSITQGSTLFAMQQHISSSASIPLIIDEYKPHAMNREKHDGMKALFRDVYNQRDVTRGGGTRDSDDYRSLHHTQLSAPVVFIAEAAEDEAAVMERVVLVTLIKPAPDVVRLWLSRFTAFRRNKHHLGILGSYIAGSVVAGASLESVRAEFDKLYEGAKDEFLVTEADIAGGISAEKLATKQNAKERSVYNHTVAKFGFQQFRRIVNSALGDKSLDGYMEAMEQGIYARMDDLTAATTPEHVKVLSVLSSMSHHVDKDRSEAVRKGEIYAFTKLNGEECIEIALRPAYHNYRGYCRTGSVNPLFASFEAFAYAVKDSPAFRKFGVGEALHVSGVYTLDIKKLAQQGVDAFKG